MIKAQEKGQTFKYNLVQYEKPTGDYLVLESLSQEKNTSRIIHIIKPTGTKTIFKLGRGHESDLRINDISVSRCHAKIKLEKGKFMLEDNTSKFGTLVLVKQRTPLLPLYNKAVQVGRTVINFSVKAQHTGSSGMVAEGTGSKYGIKEKRKESKPDSTPNINELGSAANLPMAGDNENQAMNANPMAITNAFAGLTGSANQNE